jgi:hypothetical protein
MLRDGAIHWLKNWQGLEALRKRRPCTSCRDCSRWANWLKCATNCDALEIVSVAQRFAAVMVLRTIRANNPWKGWQNDGGPASVRTSTRSQEAPPFVGGGGSGAQACCMAPAGQRVGWRETRDRAGSIARACSRSHGQ